ncbi:hypothetical protein M9Y10_039996 [Tritrichomonas musculus]|uniref:Uncharacterized protein n=1 Tax=Tritrichomonas musculus TaxID=1915356 RepID=A0ABR2GJK9_9EUKA
MIDENRKVILDFVAKEADARMTKNKFSSLTTLNFASLRVLNETNPLFPEILKTDPNSAQRLMISLKSEPDSPFGITVSSPQLLIVFDYKWIMLFKQFFAPDKVVIKTKERRSDEKNDQGKVPATVLELKKAIENYRPLDLDLSVNGASIKVLYNENVEDYNVTLSVTEAHLRSPPNYQLDPNDFSSLYDHFYIEFQDAMIHLNERQISSPLIGTFHIQSSIVSTDLFPGTFRAREELPHCVRRVPAEHVVRGQENLRDQLHAARHRLHVQELPDVPADHDEQDQVLRVLLKGALAAHRLRCQGEAAVDFCEAEEGEAADDSRPRQNNSKRKFKGAELLHQLPALHGRLRGEAEHKGRAGPAEHLAQEVHRREIGADGAVNHRAPALLAL